MKRINIQENDWNLILLGKKTCLISDQVFHVGETIMLSILADNPRNYANLVIRVTHCEPLTNEQVLLSLYCESNSLFFSFDLDAGYTFHRTLDDAIITAKKSIDEQRSKIVYPNDQWPDEMDHIGVGYVVPVYTHRAEVFNEQPVDVDEDDERQLDSYDFTCDYRLSQSLS